MIVGGGGGTGGNITVTANGGSSTSPSLTFTAQSVGGSVTAQYLTVTSASGSSPVSFVAALSGSSCGWVNLGIVAGQAYQTPLNALNVGATTTGLASGTYNCTLTLTPTGGTAVTVPLTLTVIGTPTISVSVTTLSFSYAAGTRGAVRRRLVTVTGAGSSASTFTATATSTPAGWLSVSPTSGTRQPHRVSASFGKREPIRSCSRHIYRIGFRHPRKWIHRRRNRRGYADGHGAHAGDHDHRERRELPWRPRLARRVRHDFGHEPGAAHAARSFDRRHRQGATTLGNVQVFFSGTPAPLTYVSSGQINCIVPYGVSGLSTVPIQVNF